jgi:hypothetical protein
MDWISRTYRLMNILSIDVAAGAIVSALFFARVFEVTITPFGLAALGLSVWIIYTADHLRDARKIQSVASSARHAFHQQYFRVILFALVLAICINCVLIFFIRPNVLLGGICLMVCVVLYLFFQRRFHFLKELFVALIYVGGILLPSIVVTARDIGSGEVVLIVSFFLIGLVNLYLFSWFDADKDRLDNLGSFVVKFGVSRTRLLVGILLCLCFFSALLQFAFSEHPGDAIIIILMSAVLLFIAVRRDFFSRQDLYRLCGDAIFFLPVLRFVWGD